MPPGSKIAPLGNILQFAVSGSDPDCPTLGQDCDPTDADADGLAVLVQPLPLPANATFDAATGTFTFAPAANQVGSFALTFSASDGALAGSADVIVTVPPPSGVTRLSGRVLTVGNKPLPGFHLLLGNEPGPFLDVVTRSDGSFSFDNATAGRQRLLIDGSRLPLQLGVFATVPELVELIEGADNVLDHIIYLTPLDFRSGDRVDPAVDSEVTSSPIVVAGETFPSVTLSVPAGSARRDSTGQPFDGIVYITAIPSLDLSPHPLPDDMDLSVYIAVQPFGVTYDPPVPIAFPNVDKFPIGSVVDIIGLNHATGAFEKVGDGQVGVDGMVHSGRLSDDGIFTPGGVVRSNSWHGIVPSPPKITDNPNSNSGGPENKTCDAPVGSSASLKTGNLSVSHSLISYRSRNQPQALTFEYNSTTAFPAPLVSTLSTPGNFTPPPLRMSSELIVGGVRQGSELIYAPPGTCVTTNCVFTRAFDASALPIGIYPLKHRIHCQFPVARRSADQRQDLTVINQRQSPFGAGWNLAGLQHIYPTATGDLLLTDGDDTPVVFTRATRAQSAISRAGEVHTYHFAGSAGDTVTLRMNRRSNQPDGSGSLDPRLELRDSRGVVIAADDDGGDANPAGPGKNAVIRSFSLPATDVYTLLARGAGTSFGPYDVLLTTMAGIQLVAAGSGQSPAPSIGPTILSPLGEFSKLIAKDDGSYVRRYPNSTVVEFDAQGRQTAARDRNGNETVYTYDGGGRLQTMRDPVGLVTAFRYTAGLLSEVEDPAQRITRFAHDADGNLAKITDPDGAASAYNYDTRHLLTAQTGPRGTATADPDDFVTRYEYDPDTGRFVRSFLPDGSTRRSTNAQAFGVVRTSAGDGTMAKPAVLGAIGQVQSSFTDGNGNATRFETDALGSPSKIIDALLQQAAITRDANGLPTRIQRPNGAVVLNTYDDRGNLTSTTQQDIGATTAYTYDPLFSQPTSQTDANGNTTTTRLDAAGNPIETMDAAGTATLIRYEDPNCPGFATSVVSAAGLPEETTAHTTYDPTTCNTIVTTDPLGYSTLSRYDAAGNRVESCDALGRRTRYRYDAANRLVKVLDTTTAPIDATCAPVAGADLPCPTEGNGVDGVTCYAYNAAGNLVSVINARGSRTSYEYDARDRLAASIDPLGARQTHQYDPNGNLVAIIDRKGQTIRYRYDVVNHLAEKTLLPGTAEEAKTLYSYDSVGNLKSVANPDSLLTFTYDLADRRASASTTGSPRQPNVNLTYGYDGYGNRTSMADPTGSTTYAYDTLNRLTQLTNPSQRVFTFEYDALGRRTRLARPNAVLTTYTYDLASQLKSIRHQALQAPDPISSFTYVYDPIGNRVALGQQRSTLNRTQSLTYRYNALNELTEAKRPLPAAPPEMFTYDPVGNRILRDGQTESARIDAANHLLEDQEFCYQYDGNGNLNARSSKTAGQCVGDETHYEYDANNQLVRIQNGDTIAEYRYDGLGRRIEKTLVNSAVRYVYDREDVLLEHGASGSLRARYTQGPGIDEPLAAERDGNQSGRFEVSEQIFYQRDGLGSTSDLSDSTGDATQSYVYDSFGTIVEVVCAGRAVSGAVASRAILADPTTCVANPYTYTSRESDLENDLYYFRSRYYLPSIGRFLSEDPLGSGRGTPYAYAANNPVAFVDPLGLSPADVDRIIGELGATVDYLVQNGARRPGNGKLNGSLNNLERGLGISPNYLVCGEQASILEGRANSLKLDDKWFFETVKYGAFHQVLLGTSGNPADPILILDPWKNSFEKLEDNKGYPNPRPGPSPRN